jgi:transcriptional regulator with XRE-family HTH domain
MRSLRDRRFPPPPAWAETDATALAVEPGAPLAAEIAQRVGSNLRRWRRARGMSLEKLAAVSGVSRAALSHLESSRANPTVGVLCKVAGGLAVSLASLIGESRGRVSVLRRADAPIVPLGDGGGEIRRLIPGGSEARVELQETRLAPRARHAPDPPPSGTRRILVILSGDLQLQIGAQRLTLRAGDCASFDADSPHVFENGGERECRYHDLLLRDR